MNISRCTIIAVFTLFVQTGWAQEAICPSAYNPILNQTKGSTKLLKHTQSTADTLELPFLDDFAGSLSPYPNSSFWEDQDAYINNAYGYNPLSVGIATLDALDQEGQIYTTSASVSFDADYLTSKPINLKYSSSDHAFLSFYFQPQGLGDAPESSDSLIVDFYSPTYQVWKKVWGMPGNSLQAFKAAIIPVTSDSFLVKGFKFRFHNKASIENNTDVPGKMGNVDEWNIDYVKLDVNRTDHDTVLRDIAMTKPVTSLLNDYQAMPWQQFVAVSSSTRKEDLDLFYRNNDTATLGHFVKYRYFSIRDMLGTYKNTIQYGGENIDPLSDFQFTTKLEFPFFTDQSDSAVFDVKTYLQIESLPTNMLQNDTTEFIQRFSDYFAYDDGNPEYGYGLEGQGTSNGMVACRFTSYIPDSLTAVRIFFNSTLDDLNKSYGFRLKVWSAANSSPGNLIYQSSTLYPTITGAYYTYNLDSALLIDGDYYIGWQQTDENFLNVGLDVNNYSMDHVYYNLGSWNKSSIISGSLMIRPVFGSTNTQTATDPVISATGDFQVFPNPTSGVVNIVYPEGFSDDLRASLLSMSGKAMLQTTMNEGTLDLGSLPSGIYFLILKNKEHTVYKGKIVLNH